MNLKIIAYVALALVAGFGIGFLAVQTQQNASTGQWSIQDYHTAHIEDDLYECFVDIQTSFGRPLTPSEDVIIGSAAVQQLVTKHPSWEILIDSFEILSKDPLRVYFRYRVHE